MLQKQVTQSVTYLGLLAFEAWLRRPVASQGENVADSELLGAPQVLQHLVASVGATGDVQHRLQAAVVHHCAANHH